MEVGGWGCGSRVNPGGIGEETEDALSEGSDFFQGLSRSELRREGKNSYYLRMLLYFIVGGARARRTPRGRRLSFYKRGNQFVSKGKGFTSRQVVLLRKIEDTGVILHAPRA